MLDDSDVRKMIRLLGEVAILDGGINAKKRVLMQGLCEIINADAWLWTLGTGMDKSEGKQIIVGGLHGGLDDERLSRLFEATSHPDMPKATKNFWDSVVLNEDHMTMERKEIDSDGVSFKGTVKQAWEQADIGSLIVSAVPLGDGCMSAIGIYRRVEDPDFTPREVKIAHIILQEVPWLHLSGWPEDRGATVPKLYPRQRTVLNLLLNGLGRKQIAANMDLSENTVAGYVRDIYRHFGVCSQAELMRKFLAAEDCV